MSQANMQDMLKVRNLTGWDVSFPRLLSSGAMDVGINIAKGAFVMLTRAEVYAQLDAKNILFVGEDGFGKHARVFIEDKSARVYGGFETDDDKSKQDILTDEKIVEIFEYKTQSVFEKYIKECIVTDAEKERIISAIKRLGINDYKKIQFVENYTGYKVG